MRRLTSTTLALVAVGTLTGTLLGAGTASGVTAERSADQRAGAPHYTDFALKASGFGSRHVGGDLPADSGQTAFMAVGCSTRAGIDKENHELETTIPGLGTASAVKTDLWTREVNGVVSSYAQNTIAKIVVAQSGLGRVEIRGIKAFAHSFHDAQGFHAEMKTSVATIRYVPAAGEPEELDIPTPGNPTEVPGLAKISLGVSKKHVDADGAKAQANALVINKTMAGSKTSVGQAKAQVLDGVKHGTFHGNSAGSSAVAADGNVTSGRTPLSLLPCQGTDGKVTTKKIAESDLDGNATASVLQSQQYAKQLPGKSVAWERGSVGHLNLGDGQLEVSAVVGKAAVTRAGTKVASKATASIGTILANGELQEFPDTGVLNIPGVAKLERFVTTKTKNGISVIALRITLLDGTGAVLDLGIAQTTIRR